MVPIYDSDVAEERWSRSEWNHYELWEKVEQRIRRHNRMWIAATILVFLGLSSVPIVMEQKPKWVTLASMRRLGQEINQMKREAGLNRTAYRIRFAGSGSLDYRVEQTARCDDPGSAAKTVRTGSLVSGTHAADYVLLSKKAGEEISVPGLLEEFCYDPLTGSAPFSRGESITGFGVVPAKDLTANRLDRLSVLLMSGPSAEVSFE